MKTPVGSSKDADILSALDDRKIAMLRLVFAVSALFLIFLDPTQLDRHIGLTNLPWFCTRHIVWRSMDRISPEEPVVECICRYGRGGRRSIHAPGVSQ
jgi:hypothetical protein